jgi:glycine cleavage system H protein
MIIMEGYSYINIFDTKGIEYLVIIGFLFLLIPFWWALNKPLKARVTALSPLRVLTANILKIPQGILYSRNHTWAHLEKEGYAHVGLDDLLLHIIGQVSINVFKVPGDKVVKGEQIAEISRVGGSLTIKSPISGEIQGVNTSLREDAGVLNGDPYGKGWMYQIKPERWAEETKACFLANEATLWFKTELLRFKDFMAMSINKYTPETVQVILQEGGELADNPLVGMPTEVWHDFQEYFLDQVS